MLLTIFRCREVQIFTSISSCEKAAKMLENQGIQAHVRTRDRFSPSIFSTGSRERSGSAFQKSDFQYQYILSVHRRDFDTARELLGLTLR